METLAEDFWQEVEKKRDKGNKLAGKIYDWLNKDNLGDIVLDGDVFWIESVNSYSTRPNYIHNYIIRWGEKKGYRYLYNIGN